MTTSILTTLITTLLITSLSSASQAETITSVLIEDEKLTSPIKGEVIFVQGEVKIRWEIQPGWTITGDFQNPNHESINKEVLDKIFSIGDTGDLAGNEIIDIDPSDAGFLVEEGLLDDNEPIFYIYTNEHCPHCQKQYKRISKSNLNIVWIPVGASSIKAIQSGNYPSLTAAEMNHGDIQYHPATKDELKLLAQNHLNFARLAKAFKEKTATPFVVVRFNHKNHYASPGVMSVETMKQWIKKLTVNSSKEGSL